MRFVPQSQFGFVKGCGTTDYGSALSFKIHDVLEQRDEILIVSLDVKGAFDRVCMVGQAQEQAGGQRHEWQGTAFDQRLLTRAPHTSRGRWQIIDQERDLLGCTARSKVVSQVVEP